MLAEVGILSIEDLITYYPKSYIDVAGAKNLRELKRILTLNAINNQNLKNIDIDNLLKSQQTVVAKVISKVERNIGYKRQILVINIADGSGGSAKITFWNKIHFFKNSLKESMLIAVTGKAEFDGFGINFTHPDIIVIEDEEAGLYREGRILPKYTIPDSFAKVGLTNNTLRKLIAEQLEQKKYILEETLNVDVLEILKLPKIQKSLEFIHFPQNKEELEKGRFRVKFEEIFYYELSLIMQRNKLKSNEIGLVLDPKSPNARLVYDALPFELTKDQKKVLNEIAADLKSGKPMNRLLQGDVGSGKTIVATLSMLMVSDNGFQTLIMAPTEILAEQHFAGISKLLLNTDIKVIKLLGGMKGKEKSQALDYIKNGEAQIIIGTHALFQAKVDFNKLGLIIIDEQHRFGVEQRAELVRLAKNSLNREMKIENKSNNTPIHPHILVMSATPIPRTLNLTYYGDLDISFIRTKPALRKEIITKIKFESQLKEVFDFIKDKIHEGRQAFIVYPLVEKSDKMEMLKSATEHYELLSTEVFNDFRLGLIHGQMNWREKEEVMFDFYNKKYDILIATTVIEVGIDVPNASVMVIENSDRFGLSQLHQLRGRVGRGSEQSYCFLITKDEFRIKVGGIEQNEQEKKTAVVRLKTMENTNDGFEISEVDIRLRGPGDILGVKQSGLPDFKYIDIVEDLEIVTKARNIAINVLEKDPKLSHPRNLILKQNLIRLGYNKNSYLDIA